MTSNQSNQGQTIRTQTSQGYQEMDLDLDHYSLVDLYKLFFIEELNDDTIKQAKQIVLRLHPDKSRLDSQYFVFYSQAYQRLLNMYQFQNKSSKSRASMNTEYNARDVEMDYGVDADVLKAIIDKKSASAHASAHAGTGTGATMGAHAGKGGDFHRWFNDAFEKHRMSEPDVGYGDWLKSDDDYVQPTTAKVTKDNMNSFFEQQKRQMQSMVVYTGVHDLVSMSSCMGSSLSDGMGLSGSGDNFSGNGYTDLKQAYKETVIPVSQDVFQERKQFKNVNEYNQYRNQQEQTMKPLSKAESEAKLRQQGRDAEQHSAALAYQYAVQSEQQQRKQSQFFNELKRLV